MAIVSPVWRKLAVSAALSVYTLASIVGGIFIGFHLDESERRSHDAGTYFGGAMIGLILGAITFVAAVALYEGVCRWLDWMRR